MGNFRYEKEDISGGQRHEMQGREVQECEMQGRAVQGHEVQRRAVQRHAMQSHTTQWHEELAEATGTFAAGIAGPLSFAMASKSKYGAVAGLAACAIAGGTSKILSKWGTETALGSESRRTTSFQDFYGGAIDGFSGLAGSYAESLASRHLIRYLGMKYVGSQLTSSLLEQTGKKVLASSVTERLSFQALKGLSAGSVAGFTSSAAHLLSEQKESDKDNWLKTGKQVASATFCGGVAGMAFGSLFSASKNAVPLFRYGLATMPAGAKSSRVDILHFNDMHSALLGKRASLPQLASEVDRLRNTSGSKGRTALLFELGDNYSGNVVSGHTDVGYVETKSIHMMKPDAVVPGNHVADTGHGNVDIESWVKNIKRIERESGQVFPGVAANISLRDFPDFVDKNGFYRPFRIAEIKSQQGTEKIGLVGLVTHELTAAAGDSVKYRSAEQSLRTIVGELHKQGINKIIVLSHLGRSEDIKLASSVKGISAIIGGHSHDIEPIPLWIKNKENGADIPIVQAGEKSTYLGELNLVFKPDGSADKYRTAGRLHEIHQGIKHHPQIDAFVQHKVGNVAALAEHKYKAHASARFDLYGIRGEERKETPLGSLVSKALLEGVNKNLTSINAARAADVMPPLKPVRIMLKHSGDIRDGINAGAVDHLTLSNVFLNTGSRERELNELTVVQLTGTQIEKVLNFGVHDLPKVELVPEPKHIGQKLLNTTKAFLAPEGELEVHDHSGNFLQVEGLKYQLDLSLPVGKRIAGVQVFDSKSGNYLPLEQNQSYPVLTLFHPLEKWGKKGMLTTDSMDPAYYCAENWVFEKQYQQKAVRELVNAQPLKLSQVDLLADYLVAKQKIAPSDFSCDSITDLTPKTWTPIVKPAGYAAAALFLTSGNKRQFLMSTQPETD